MDGGSWVIAARYTPSLVDIEAARLLLCIHCIVVCVVSGEQSSSKSWLREPIQVTIIETWQIGI